MSLRVDFVATLTALTVSPEEIDVVDLIPEGLIGAVGDVGDIGDIGVLGTTIGFALLDDATTCLVPAPPRPML